METSWYRSKGVWGGILVMIGVAAKLIVTQRIEEPDIIYAGIGLGLLGIRLAMK